MTAPVRFKLRKARDGSWYFVQVAANGQILTASETYTRRESAEDGAKAAGCPEGSLEDDTMEDV